MQPHKYRRLPYIAGIWAGIILMILEIKHYNNTIISHWLSYSLFIFISLISFFIIQTKANRPFPSKPLLTLVICALSCALPACFLISGANYYFSGKIKSEKKFPIVQKLPLGYRSEWLTVYANCNGVIKKFDFVQTPQKNLENATDVILKTRRGLLGFDVIDSFSCK